MFQATDFLHLAQRLVGTGTMPASGEMLEARVRTALSRSYYAVYLLIRTALVRRHGIRPKHLQHGAVYTRLQSSALTEDARLVGRSLEWLYTLRQKADYDLDPEPAWRGHLQDARQAATLAQHALDLSGRIPTLDFSPIIFLLDPGLRDLHG